MCTLKVLLWLQVITQVVDISYTLVIYHQDTAKQPCVFPQNKQHNLQCADVSLV